MREREFVRHLLDSQPRSGDAVELDVGDDMAVVRIDGGRVLAAIDAVVEGRHFLAGTDPMAIGRKAVLRNLSDVAAMAGRPVACLASATLPANCSDGFAERLLEGLRSAAAQYGCPLVGGDTSTHRDPGAPLVVSVAVLASPADPGGRVVARRGSRVGDLVSVTGVLGGAFDADGGGRHLDFAPRLGEARELASRLGEDLHAMIDLSDGLGVDAGHLVEAEAGIAIEIDASRLPCAPGLDWTRAVSDGEDFELLFSSSVEPPRRLGDVPVATIGRVVARGDGPAVGLRVGGALLEISGLGFEHGAERPSDQEDRR